MKKKEFPSEEAAELRRRTLVMLRFFEEVSPSPAWAQIAQVTETTFQDRNIKGLRTVAKDIAEAAEGLSPGQQAELEIRLNAEGNPWLSDLRTAESDQVVQILERNTIRNEDEFRLLERHVSRIYEDSAQKATVERINDLIVRSRFR